MDEEFAAFLDDISLCFIKRDLTLWRSRVILPVSIITKTGPVLLEDEAALAENFGNYLQASDIMQLDLVVRSPISLQDCQDGTWLGTFETRLMSHDRLATAPYTSTALLQLIDNRFRMSSMLNGRGHSEWTNIHDR